MSKKKKPKKVKERDLNILKSVQREINLNTRSVPDKSKYSRKTKHKAKQHD